jgi:DNA-directed RNA polymerase specialized sigma24 family protein
MGSAANDNWLQEQREAVLAASQALPEADRKLVLARLEGLTLRESGGHLPR